METVTIHGLREMREALMKKIPAEMQGKVLQQALSAGAKIMVDDAKARAPKDTGVLRRALWSFRVKQNSNGVFEERAIRPRSGKKYQKSGRDAYYWRFVEFGHMSRNRTPVPAKPFLRPAFETRKNESVTAIVKRLGIAIDRAAKKAAWGNPRR